MRRRGGVTTACSEPRFTRAREERDGMVLEREPEQLELVTAAFQWGRVGQAWKDDGLRRRIGEEGRGASGLQRLGFDTQATPVPAARTGTRRFDGVLAAGGQPAEIEPGARGHASRRSPQQLQAPGEFRARAIERIERSAADQRLGLVGARAGALEEVGQRQERSLGLAGGEQSLERRPGQPLHRGEARPQPQGPRPARTAFELEVRPALVDLGPEDSHAESPRLFDVHARGVVARLVQQERRQERRGEVRLEPRGAVRDASVRDGVCLAEREGREVRDEVPDRLRILRADALSGGAVEEAPLQRHEFLEATLLERAPQPIGLGEVHARELGRGLHDVLLVEHHAVRVAQHAVETGMRRARILEAVHAPDVRILHPRSRGPRPDERHRLDHIVHPARLHLEQEMTHARRLDLEATKRSPLPERARCVRILLGRIGRIDVEPLFAQEAHAIVERAERPVAEEVHLDEPDRLDAILVELRDDGPLGRRLARDDIGDTPRRDDDAAGVEPEVPRRVEQRRGSDERTHEPLIVERKAPRLGQALEGVNDRIVPDVRGDRGVRLDRWARRP